MMVYVNGQEISHFVLGVWQAGAWKIAPQVLADRPEAYLASLEAFMAAHKLARTDIQGFILIKGPGSATALRAAHAMVNALAFALQVPVVSLEKPAEVADVDMAALIANTKPGAFGLPIYAHTPNITATKRDALKRKLV